MAQNLKNNKEKGNLGEDIATKYLQDKGYLILERNFTSGKAEIDIIAQHQNDIVFVEVKTRFNALLEPEKAVTKAKQKHLAFAATAFIEDKQPGKQARFDIISINFINNKPQIEHFEDAFYPYIAL